MKVLLHYIGNRTYSERLFVREAERYGVCRAMPPSLALSLKPGDRVLLAFYVRNRVTGERGAKVVGYMVVTGYTLPPDPDIDRILEEEGRLTGGGYYESRGCGSMYIGAVYDIGDWDSLVEKLRRLLKQGKRFKIFVNGVFHRLQPYVIPNLPFNRAGVYINAPAIPAPQPRVPRMARVYHEYERIEERARIEKEALAIALDGGLLRYARC